KPMSPAAGRRDARRIARQVVDDGFDCAWPFGADPVARQAVRPTLREQETLAAVFHLKPVRIGQTLEQNLSTASVRLPIAEQARAVALHQVPNPILGVLTQGADGEEHAAPHG